MASTIPFIPPPRPPEHTACCHYQTSVDTAEQSKIRGTQGPSRVLHAVDVVKDISVPAVERHTAPSPPQVSSGLALYSLLSVLLLLQTTNVFSAFIDFTALKGHIVGTIQYVDFSEGLFLLATCT